MNLSTHKSLQSRIREATGADRDLDFAICKTFKLGPLWCSRYITDPDDMAPRFTTDPDGLGACVGLIRSLFRTVRVEMDEDPSGCGARVVVWGKGLDEPVTTDAKSAGICMWQALLDCVIAAVIAEEEAKLTEKAG